MNDLVCIVNLELGYVSLRHRLTTHDTVMTGVLSIGVTSSSGLPVDISLAVTATALVISSIFDNLEVQTALRVDLGGTHIYLILL